MTPRAGGDEFRVGLIGYGIAGAFFHSPFIVTTPRLRLAAIVTSQPERQARARADHPAAIIHDSIDTLWTANDLDLIIIASPNRTHVPLARAAWEAGCSVVVDKPIAATSAEAQALVDLFDGHDRFLTVFQNRRFDGDFLTLRRLLDAGELGEPLRFESRFERWRPQLTGGWRERATPGDAGGLLYDLGPHLIDQALQLFGPVTTVYAEMDARRTEAEVDDDTFVALTHATGVYSHLWMSVMAAQSGPRFRMLGTKAAYVKLGLDLQEPALRAGQRPGGPDWGIEPESHWGTVSTAEHARVEPTTAGAYQQFYTMTARALAGEGAVPVDPRDAVRGLKIIEAARRAAEQGCAVIVDDIAGH